MQVSGSFIHQINFVVLLLLTVSLNMAYASDIRSAIPKQKESSDFNQGENPLIIRALVVLDPAYYFVDKGKQYGISFELLQEFERYINKKYHPYNPKGFNIVFIPVARNQLIPLLQQGIGDIIVAHMTETEQRKKQIQFTQAINRNIDEILVTQAGKADINSAFSLSGKTLWLRQSSSYFESVQTINKGLTQVGQPPIYVKFIDEQLEDSDLLEMLNAGLIEQTIVDSHKAKFWQSIFTKIQLHPKATFRVNGKVSWAVRKENPLLLKELNAFIKQHRKGTLFGNLIFWRYLKHNNWAKNAFNPKQQDKFIKILGLIKQYSKQYEFNWMMITAQGFQESGLNQAARSHMGAVGVMQILPSTAREPYINLPNVHRLDDNIHAGIKYMSFIRKHYFNNPEIDPINKQLLSFAAYNAGPTKIKRLRKLAFKRGYNGNIWFNNMEVIVAEKIGRETVQYVNNIYKYYLAYRYVREQNRKKQAVKLRWQSKRTNSTPAYSNVSMQVR